MKGDRRRLVSIALLLLLPGCLLATARVGNAQGIEGWEVDARNALQDRRWDATIRIVDSVLTTDPDLMRARLLRAMAYREKADFIFDNVRGGYYLDPSEIDAMWGAVRAELGGTAWGLDFGRNYDVARAMFDFETLLAADSSFDGVLYEYAKLWHDHHVFHRAIELGERQIALDANLPRAHEELIETYRHYIAWTAAAKALPWLEARGSPYAEYFIGEVYRREGQLERADLQFASILERPVSIPPQPVLLSRARIRIAEERFEAAHAFLEEAMQLETPVQARLLYRDFFYVMDGAEFAEAQTLSTVADYADFYERLWARRNPTPGSRINWRLVEHYRRLVVAEREYEYFGPRLNFREAAERYAASMQPTVPPMYWETHGMNDKGLIYIRHGDPDEKVVTVRAGLNESWRYLNAELDFHFLIPNLDGIAYSWPLVPYLDGCEVAADRRHWGHLYSQIAPRVNPNDPTDPCGVQSDTPIAVLQAKQRLARVGQKYISEGLSTDRHTWETREIESFDFPFDVVTFRGADGQTDVSVYFALPVGRFSGAVPSNVLPVDVGFAFHDTTWRPVVERSQIREFEGAKDPTKAGFEALHTSVPPDTYRVSIYSELIGSDLLGGYQFGRRVPDYSESRTMMSDVLVAYDIRPKPGHVPSVRSSLQFLANPFHVFSVDQVVHVYFELYRLALDDDDIARYEVTYRIEPEKQGGILARLQNRGPALSVSASYDDTTPSPIVVSQLDVSELDPGSYSLVVDVTDTVSGTELSRRVGIELEEPDSQQ